MSAHSAGKIRHRAKKGDQAFDRDRHWALDDFKHAFARLEEAHPEKYPRRPMPAFQKSHGKTPSAGNH